MKTNDVIYTLKKLEKQVKGNTIDFEEMSLSLRKITYSCNKKCHKGERAQIMQLIGYLFHKTLNKELILLKVQSLLKFYKARLEKEKVMRIREANARIGFFYSTSSTDYYRLHQNLKFGDIIKVPTQGGSHYSIVNKVNRDSVECYPLTTAKRKELDLLGVDSRVVVDYLKKGGTQKLIRITDSKVHIPLCSHFDKVGAYKNLPQLNKVINSFC